MLKSLALVLLLAVAGSVAQYARYEEVVRNPATFDLLYGTYQGSVNEAWYFTAAVKLDSLIIPSMASDICAPGMRNATYEEAIDILVYEVKLSTTGATTYLVANGSFSATVTYGQELDIPLRSVKVDGPPPVQKYVNAQSGFWYRFTIVFKMTGVYPWYTTRALSTYSVVNSLSNSPGIAIGLSYHL